MVRGSLAGACAGAAWTCASLVVVRHRHWCLPLKAGFTFVAAFPAAGRTPYPSPPCGFLLPSKVRVLDDPPVEPSGLTGHDDARVGRLSSRYPLGLPCLLLLPLPRQRLLLVGAHRRREAPRVCRRPFRLSHAAMAGCSSMA
jgi:hypothetical protein